MSPTGDILGIDYTAVNFILDIYNISNKKRVFEKVLICFETERELIDELSNS